MCIHTFPPTHVNTAIADGIFAHHYERLRCGNVWVTHSIRHRALGRWITSSMRQRASHVWKWQDTGRPFVDTYTKCAGARDSSNRPAWCVNYMCRLACAVWCSGKLIVSSRQIYLLDGWFECGRGGARCGCYVQRFRSIRIPENIYLNPYSGVGVCWAWQLRHGFGLRCASELVAYIHVLPSKVSSRGCFMCICEKKNFHVPLANPWASRFIGRKWRFKACYLCSWRGWMLRWITSKLNGLDIGVFYSYT